MRISILMALARATNDTCGVAAPCVLCMVISQERTYKWIRVNRKKWVMSDEHYSRRQVYSALRLLTKIDAITPSQNGWIIRRHEVWTEKVNGVCRVRQLERVLREEMTRKGKQIEELSGVLAPVLPRNARTRVTVLEHAIQRKGRS